jgi:hypothetical protein
VDSTCGAFPVMERQYLPSTSISLEIRGKWNARAWKYFVESFSAFTLPDKSTSNLKWTDITDD